MKLTAEDLDLAHRIHRLFKSGFIKISVNIEPEYAEKGSGQWNVTRTYIKFGDTEFIQLDNGNVEIIEGI